MQLSTPTTHNQMGTGNTITQRGIHLEGHSELGSAGPGIALSPLQAVRFEMNRAGRARKHPRHAIAAPDLIQRCGGCAGVVGTYRR